MFKTQSAALFGIDAYLVEVEVDLAQGGKGELVTVGLPDAAVKESRERIKSAIKNCGFNYPSFQNITVNLAPADVKKEGSGFDLPMALGILGTTGAFFGRELGDFVFVGELALDGVVRPIRGALSIAVAAREKGIAHLVVPEANAREAAVVRGVKVYAAKSLPQVVDLANDPGSAAPVNVEPEHLVAESTGYGVDLRD
ncbi:MAG: magnesium chelatase domain-containing protein, partial [Terriglobia bacterium]